MNSRNILVICDDKRLRAELKPLISQHLPLTPITEVDHHPDRSALTAIVSSKPPTLCFLDVASNKDYGLAVLADLVSLSPNTQVVVILAGNNPDLILQCLRQGATEFLLQPLNSEQMHPVLERLSQLSSFQQGGAVEGGAKVISVIPVKGACGASTVAANLAAQWKRRGFKKILLADMDPSTGTISFLLKIKSTYSFLDALSRAGTLDADLWKGLVTHTQGIDVLLSPDNAIDHNQDLRDPGDIIDFSRQHYQHVTLDLGGPFSQWSASIANASDEILLVTTNELPALRAAQRVLQNLDRININRSKIRLIVNRYSTDVGLNQDTIETALHTEVFHVVPSDYEAVQRALVEGKPIAPTTSFGKSLAALAEQLAGKPEKETTEKKKPSSSSWGSLFSSFASKLNS